MAAGPVDADRSGAGLYGKPGPMCRDTALGSAIAEADATEERPVFNAGELAVGGDGGHCRLAEEDLCPDTPDNPRYRYYIHEKSFLFSLIIAANSACVLVPLVELQWPQSS